MKDLAGILITFGPSVILPITIVWLVMRKKINDMNKRTEIILAVIDKNPDIDVKEYLKTMAQPEKSVKEKLIKKLTWACVLISIGIFCGGYGLIMDMMGGNPRKIEFFAALGCLLTLVGIGILIVFFVSKKIMARELANEKSNSKK